MKKRFAYPVRLALAPVLVSMLMSGGNLVAQNHVVSPSDMQKDMVEASAKRQQNQKTIVDFLSSPQGREALKSAHMDPQQVTNAVGQLSDSEMASLAARADNAQKAFAAGRISDHTLLLILVGLAAIIIIIAVA